jgi:hypothetical protein
VDTLRADGHQMIHFPIPEPHKAGREKIAIVFLFILIYSSKPFRTFHYDRWWGIIP